MSDKNCNTKISNNPNGCYEYNSKSYIIIHKKLYENGILFGEIKNIEANKITFKRVSKNKYLNNTEGVIFLHGK